MSDDDWSGRRAQAALTHVLRRDKGICWICGHPGADSCDHIVPRSVAPERTWDETNWAAAHGAARPEYDCPGQYRRGAYAGPRRPTTAPALITVVMGPPTAGKTTHVDTHRQATDVVVDLDTIAHALGWPTGHGATGTHLALAKQARQTIIDRVLNGISSPAWIIDTAPSPANIAAYTRANATPVLIDPGKGTCLQRAKHRGTKGTTPAILDWYTHHRDRLTQWTPTPHPPASATSTGKREW